MKRAVYEAVGGLDERFGLGFFDDDDLAERARRAGFDLAVAKDLFVHHFGSRTFAGNGVDAGKLLDENALRFAEKWGLAAPNGRRVTLQTWHGNGQAHAGADGYKSELNQYDLTQSREDAKNANGVALNSSCDDLPRLPHFEGDLGQNGLAHPAISSSLAPLRLCVRSSSPTDDADAPSSGERATVSLTMIVKNEENNLPACLESVRGLFDEIVVVDTGSTDRTVEIAHSFGQTPKDMHCWRCPSRACFPVARTLYSRHESLRRDDRTPDVNLRARLVASGERRSGSARRPTERGSGRDRDSIGG
jgi:hypothetical protein